MSNYEIRQHIQKSIISDRLKDVDKRIDRVSFWDPIRKAKPWALAAKATLQDSKENQFQFQKSEMISYELQHLEFSNKKINVLVDLLESYDSIMEDSHPTKAIFSEKTFQNEYENHEALGEQALSIFKYYDKDNDFFVIWNDSTLEFLNGIGKISNSMIKNKNAISATIDMDTTYILKFNLLPAKAGNQMPEQ